MRFLWPMIGICACWWAIAECAGESDASTVSQVAQWRLSPRPVIDIGVASGDPVYELTDAASSLRLDDGGIVISDVGVGELRYFDAHGRYRMTADAPTAAGRPLSSRRGRLRRNEPDSAAGVAFEGAGRRLTFDAQGKLVAEAAGVEPTVRIHRRTLLLGGTRQAQAVAIEALERMPAVDSATGYRVVRLDRGGYLWVEGRIDSASVRRPWSIYDPQGRLVGRAATLASFEPHEIGKDFMLGRWRDGNGIEHIRMYGLERDERIASRRDSPTARPPKLGNAQRAAALIAIRRSLQDLALLQEGYWSKTMTYASDPALLQLTPPDGVEIAIVGVGVGGWKAVAYVHAADTMCGISAGREGLPGWEDGLAMCY